MIAWAVETLVATTLLMLLVLAIRAPVRRSFGPAVAYALWAIPVLRMILPPLPGHWRGEALPTLPVPEDIIIYLGEPVATLPVEPAHGLGWPPVVLALWVAGAALFAAYHLIAHRRFCDRVRRGASSTSVVAAGNVRVIRTDAAAGPLAFGVLRKFVAFPRDFADRYDPLEQDLALAHELGHHARGDLIANWVALAVLALHWFNPVAWRAFRAFRADQEMACDALVLAGRARELRAAYGRAIVKSAHGGAVSAACHLHTINEIKGRLKMLTQHEKTSRRRRVAGTAGIAALLAGGLTLTASGTHASERVRSEVESATGVDLSGIALPALPAMRAISAMPALPAAPHQAQLPPPPAPALPPAPAGKKTVRVIVTDKDGGTQTYTSDTPEGLAQITGQAGEGRRVFFARGKDGVPLTFKTDPMSPELRERLAKMQIELRNMPTIASRDCREDEGKAGSHVLRKEEDGRKVTIICTNRLVAATAFAGAGPASLVIRRNAEASALDGLRSARRSIEGNTTMGAAQRTAALDGIAAAIRELEAKQD